MQTIVIKRTDTTENITSLAYILGYKDEIQDGEIEKDVFDGEDKIGTELVVNLVKNPETPIEFVSRYYLNMIDSHIIDNVLIAKKKQLLEARNKEDEALQETIKSSMGESSFIVE